jgi:hypothetical protein
MDYWRRSARISRKDKIINNVIKEKMNVTRSLLDAVKTKQLQWYGQSKGWRGGGETAKMGTFFIIENQEPLHVSSITCSFAGSGAQVVFGILRAYDVSSLWHVCSGTAFINVHISQITDSTCAVLHNKSPRAR